MNSEKYHFHKLTPTVSADIHVYQEAIDFVFKNPDIHNVAISGAYSAGKSSLLESYKVKHREKKFLHLSLAHFVPAEEQVQPSESDQKENIAQDVPIKESVLEGKILNQLLHQIPADKIPQTNFKVKREITRGEIAWTTAFFILYIFSVLRILLWHQLQNLAGLLQEGVVHKIVMGLLHPYGIVAAAGICTLCTGVLIYKIIRLQKNRSLFKKINLHGNEIEIFEKQDESYFDKYLNEVLYLFENSGADVIVFEDMDRFNSSQIFERLHEINRLINVRRQKDNKEERPLRFFYLLRDDMFISKDRTKFFDFIIPVVPVIDGSNSYNKFLEFFRNAGFLTQFDLSFLQSLSLYVDDMRVLKNICNEFTIYINRVNTISLDWNRMLALIVYKNLFPQDFSNLQIGKGFVNELFHKKKELAADRLKELNRTKEKLLKDITCIEKEVLISSQELDAALQKAYDMYRHIYGRTTEDTLEYQRYEEDIQKRRNRMQDRNEDDRECLAQKLSEIEYQILHIETAPLKDLITRDNIGELFSATHTNEVGPADEFNDIKSNHYFDLLKFLVRNGYIDETYPDYMSYFYEDSISAHDKTFLRRITDRRGAEYSYHLKDVKKIAESPVLRTVEFEQEETLNFDLLHYLLRNLEEEKYAEYVNTLITQLRTGEKFDFIAQYYDLNQSRPEFVTKLNEQWNGFFQTVLQNERITPEQIKSYSVDTLYYSEDDVIQAVDIDGCLREYISQTPEYIVMGHPNVEKLIEGFELLGVLIEQVTGDGVEPSLLDAIYRKRLYVLNIENMEFFLRKDYGIDDKDGLKHRNYTLISSQKEEPLYQYVMENLEAYVTVMLSNCGGVICDTEEAAVQLLNQKEVQLEQKQEYIRSLTTNVTALPQIADTSLWTYLMEGRKILPSAENLLYFFKKFGLDTTLISYINDLPEDCDFSQIEETFEETDRQKLFSSIVECQKINDDKYEIVLLGLNFELVGNTNSKITDTKFSILIRAKIILMNMETLRFVRSNYSEHKMEFIRWNTEEYLELQSDEIAEYDEVVEMLDWDIPDEDKLHLLAYIYRSISIIEKSYTDRVSAHILEHNYDSNDFEYLCKEYSSYGMQTRDCILQKAIDSVYDIYRYRIDLDDELLSELLKSECVERSYKIRFFTDHIHNMNEETCQRHLRELGLGKLCHIFDGSNGRYNYDKTEEVTGILDGLKNEGWIYDYRTDTRNKEKYTVIKNVPQKK